MNGPTPLARHAISLTLQYLLPPSELPTHLISRALLQRHHFLSISPTDSAAYLCWPNPHADPEKSIAALEHLATQDHEQLVQTADIRYQSVAASEPVQARVWLGNAVQLVFVWEEDQDGAGWRYFDADHRPLPTNCTPTLAPALHITPPEQAQEQDPSPGASHSSSGLTSHSYVSTPASGDYWAGYGSDSPRSPRIPERELAADDEDAYWASYGAVHGSADSTVPSPAPQKHKRLDAWGREELPWEEHAEMDARAWDADAASGHGLGVTVLSNSRPPTPPSMPARTLALSTQVQPQQIAPLPDLNHRNWTSPPSSLSAPFSALSEPDDAPLDEEPENDSKIERAPSPAAAPESLPAASKAASAADAGLSSAIKGMYAIWLASRPDGDSIENKQAFMSVVRDTLADA